MSIKGLTLSPMISDKMILQREAVNYIYGKDSEAAVVSVFFLDTQYDGEVDEKGNFKIALPPMPAGGPYTLTVKGSKEIKIKDILFGDVYLLSGQSNMELPIRRVLDVSGEEISKTCEPTIRQYHIPPHFKFNEPEEFVYQNSWKEAFGEALLEFSAVGYFFAKEIKETYQIPVGLILTASGGSCIEAWMNPTTLEGFGDYNSAIEDFKEESQFFWFLQEQQEKVNDWLNELKEKEQTFHFDEDYKNWEVCKVPSLVADYDTTFEGSVYLCKEVYLEEEPESEDAYIYMGTLIDSDVIWINHQEVGRTEYRYPPRKYKFGAGILKKGKNVITIRLVINNQNGGTVEGKPYHLFYDGKTLPLEGDWYYRVGKRADQAMPPVVFPPTLPIGLYHTTYVPLSKTSLKGILWYQGESNTKDPKNYAEKFTAMVSDVRDLFGWEVPFLYAQLPNYLEPLNPVVDSGWAELRNQQRQCLTLYDVAMVTTLDVGEYNDLHPQKKKSVGIRLANAAKSLIYGENLVFCGPVPKRMSVDGNVAKIVFKYLEEDVLEQELNNFELAGKDGVFKAAKAIRQGKYVYLTNEEISLPKYARYAWCDNPTELNFFNAASLPASTFQIQ